MSYKLLKNFSFVFLAQVLVLAISIARALILPHLFTVDGFGYWEVYWFYTCYVGLFALGYNDGIYLKYGERDYKDLPLGKIRSANWIFIAVLTFFTLTSIALINIYVGDANVRFGLTFAAVNILIVCFTAVYIYILQITGQFKRYSIFSVLDKVLVILIIVWMVIVNDTNYKLVVVADCISKVLILLMLIVKVPSLLFGKLLPFGESFRYMLGNMRIGVKLMIANLMSMLLIGAGKFIVQILGNISDFAMYSFGMSITGLVLTCVTAISLVLYPTIKRLPEDRYSSAFSRINHFTRILGITGMMVYFPAYLFINYYYAKYQPVLQYLNILFIIVFLQCKISILFNTFYKALRQETLMLRVNMLCVLFFCIIALLGYWLWSTMYTIALCTAIALFYRSYDSERYFNSYFHIKDFLRMGGEVVFILFFFIATAWLDIYTSMAVVAAVYVAWLLVDRKNHLATIKSVISK